jgi:hypothetical protein
MRTILAPKTACDHAGVRQNSIRAKQRLDYEMESRFKSGIRLKPGIFRDRNSPRTRCQVAAIVRRTQLSRSSSSVLKRNLRGSSSGGQVVATMQAAESWHRNDPALPFQDDELLPKRQISNSKLRLDRKNCANRSKQKTMQKQYEASLAQGQPKADAQSICLIQQQIGVLAGHNY